jgi:hypothetical protein
MMEPSITPRLVAIPVFSIINKNEDRLKSFPVNGVNIPYG